MSKFIYCSNCGAKLQRYRKAVKGLGKIIDIIDPHVCTEEPMPLDFAQTEVVEYEESPQGKFVEKLNDLKATGVLGQVSTMDLRDRRVEQDIKTTAPGTVLDQIKNMTNSAPEHDLEDPMEGD